jgi:hypothetical protein
MSNDNRTFDIANVDTLIEDLSTVDASVDGLGGVGVVGSVTASLAWSFAMSLAQTETALARVHDANDPRYGRLSADEAAERLQTLDARADELADVLSWACSYAHPDFVPSGADVAARIVESQGSPQTSEMDIQAAADAMGVSAEEAKAAAQADAQRREADQKLQQRAAQVHQAAIADRVQRAIDSHCPAQLMIDPRDAVRLFERIASKCETYEQNRVSQAFRTRRARRIQQLAAERRLLADVMNKADDAASRVDLNEDAKAAEAAVDNRVIA